MFSPTVKTVASYLTLLLMLATQTRVVQSRLLEPIHNVAVVPPTNCQGSDFELPQALLGAWTQEELPPFITTEIFATFVGLKDGWTPGFASTKTPIVARLTHLIDTMNWNCAAMYSST